MNSGIRLQGLLCIALALATPASATGQAGKFTPACAERDLKVVAFIEQSGEAGDMASDLLGEIGLAHLQARSSCLDGNEAEALAIYDRILRVEAVAWKPKD